MSTHAHSSIELHAHKDYTSSKIGIWLFLATEVLLFGGMFLLYAVYRSIHPEDFSVAASELDTYVGCVNTVILLTSSLTMALAIAAVHHGNRMLSVVMLWATVFCGGWFMYNKYFEWGAKISHGIYPGSAHLATFPQGEQIFYGLYFTMTGLHGVHVIIGMILLAVMALKTVNQPNAETNFIVGHGLQDAYGCRVAIIDNDNKPVWTGEEIDDSFERIAIKTKYWPVKRRFKVEDFNLLENSGLYWHIVDIVWIFLFPLFYLIT